MHRLAELARRRRWLVVGVWVVVLVAAMPLASHQNDHLTSGGFEVGGSQSASVERTVRQQFPNLTGERMALVLQGGPGATRADYQAAVARFQKALGSQRRVRLAPGALARAGSLRGGEHDVLLPLVVNTTVQRAVDTASDIRHDARLDEDQSGPVRLHLVGRAAQVAAVHEVSEADVKEAEGIGLPAVLLILLAIVGSLAAAMLPLALGVVSVTITGALVYLISRNAEMSVFVVNVASMLGIGVAVDYSLFLLSRYREEIARGSDRPAALEVALRTSGQAVVFAGGTVVVSLVTLFLLDNTILRSMAAGAIVVVTIAVLVSVTLLPALIALLGPRVERRGRVVGAVLDRARRLRRDRTAREGDFWTNWTTRVMRRPVAAALLSAGVLLALSAPVLDIKVGLDTLRLLPSDHETRTGVAIASGIEGPGAGSPVVVTARFGERVGAAGRERGIRSLSAAMARDPELRDVRVAGVSRDGGTAVIAAIPRHDPETNAGLDVVGRLRDRLPAVAAGAGASVQVGGTSATIVDAGELIERDLWKVIVAVLALSFVILLLLLRSLVLPIKAILMNLLSVGAATGVLVAVFQWHWFGSALGTEETGHLQIFVPPLVFAVVYGLSMDYEVFLLTRIRERYLVHGDTRRAVAEGVSSSARTVSSAALIMVAVFAIFAFTSVPVVQQIGLGSAVAVGIDATLTRLVLLPATMTLLGRWNWWMPAVLRRALDGVRGGPAVARAPGGQT